MSRLLIAAGVIFGSVLIWFGGSAQATLGGCVYHMNYTSEIGSVQCSYATTTYRARLTCERASDNYRVSFWDFTSNSKGQLSWQDCDNLNGLGYSGTWDIKAVYVSVP
jgi:hypothetical protein